MKICDLRQQLENEKAQLEAELQQLKETRIAIIARLDALLDTLKKLQPKKRQ